MGTGEGHAHGALTAAGRHRTRLALVLATSVVVLAVQVVGGVLSGSVALLADAGHVLGDTSGLALALVGITLAQRPATLRRTWGLARAEVLAAAVNAVVLGAIAVLVLLEAGQRLREPTDVATGTMLVAAVVGLLGNAVGVGVLASVRDAALPLRAAFLEVAVDAASSVGVVGAALLQRYAGVDRADAVVAVLIALLVLPRAWRLLRDALDVLLEATPRHVDLARVREHVLGVDHVLDVHDLHASLVTSGLAVLTAHVVVEDSCFADGHAPQVLDALQACLAGDFDVEHSTFQLEPAGHAHHERGAHG